MQPTPHPRCPARSQCAASQCAMARRAVSSVLALAAAASPPPSPPPLTHTASIIPHPQRCATKDADLLRKASSLRKVSSSLQFRNHVDIWATKSGSRKESKTGRKTGRLDKTTRRGGECQLSTSSPSAHRYDECAVRVARPSFSLHVPT